jgi:carbonic anhydrase
MKINLRICLIFLSALIISGCSENHNTTEDSNHKDNHKLSEDIHDNNVISHDAAYSVSCIGPEHAQSPINILSQETSEGKHNVTFNFEDKINKIENLGHTVQLDFEPGSTIIQEGKTFEFKQMHFHTPSEHLIDGVTFPMELHIVNQLIGQKEGEKAEYLVIAGLFRMGEESLFINEFIDAIPQKANTSLEIEPGVVRLNDLLHGSPQEQMANCYHYEGSLTTNPFTETVHWYVSKHVFEASPEQIRRINLIEGDNARHVQALYGRDVIKEEQQ